MNEGMSILINKQQFISALAAFIPDGEIFQIHDMGEYGEVIMSLWDEDRERHEFFTDFLAHCEISQDADALKQAEKRQKEREEFDKHMEEFWNS